MIYYFFLAGFVLLMGYVFYHQVCALRWEESEIRRLEALELDIAIVQRLIEAPDVRWLMQQRRSRQDLFLEFSKGLKRDVVTLLRWRALSFTATGWACLFLLCYYVLRIKARLVCGSGDLQFLSGLELALIRSMPE
jgi:hypothetical protein